MKKDMASTLAWKRARYSISTFFMFPNLYLQVKLMRQIIVFDKKILR
jgi:hypothetical protein